jgi:hypothetical protein
MLWLLMMDKAPDFPKNWKQTKQVQVVVVPSRSQRLIINDKKIELSQSAQ